MSKPITFWDVAEARGVKTDTRVTADDLAKVDIAIMGGCLICEASLAVYNGYPSKSGYWKCADCIGDDGFATVVEYDSWCKKDEEEPTKAPIMVTRHKGGTHEHTVQASVIEVPDLWHIAMMLQKQGDTRAEAMVLETWHLAHDLLKHIREEDQQ